MITATSSSIEISIVKAHSEGLRARKAYTQGLGTCKAIDMLTALISTSLVIISII